MATAEKGKKYAQIVDGHVHWIFTAAELPEWDGESIVVVDVTGLAVAVGDSYDGACFASVQMPSDVLRTALLSAITAERDRREAGTFPYRGRAIDCDPRAVQRITTAAMAAQAALATGQAFSLDWTCADNSVLQLDAAGVIGMPLALAAFADELHQHARMLKELVMTAADEVALSAIDINHGWPGDAAPAYN